MSAGWTPQRVAMAALMFFLGAFVFSATFSIAATQTSLAAGVALWAVLMIRDRPLRPRSTPLDLPLLALIAAALISTALSGDIAAALWNLRNYLLFVVIYFVAALAAGERVQRGLFLVLLVSGAAAALYGVALSLLGHGEGTLGRTSGSFSTAMTFGGVMMMLLSVFAAVAVAAGITRRTRACASAAAFATAAALWLSFTRSSWLGMLASLVVILALLRGRWLIPALACLVVGAVLLPSGPYRQRITSIWDPTHRTNVHRIHVLRGGIDIFRRYPVFGTGPVDLAEIYRAHMPPGAVVVWGHMHNNFLQIAVTLGALGLAAFVWLLAGIFRLLSSTLRLDLPPPQRAWAAGCLGAMTGFVVNGMFEWNFGDAEVLTLMLILVGSCQALRARRPGLNARSAQG